MTVRSAISVWLIEAFHPSPNVRDGESRRCSQLRSIRAVDQRLILDAVIATTLKHGKDLIPLTRREVNVSPIEDRFVYVSKLLDYLSREVAKHEKPWGRRKITIDV